MHQVYKCLSVVHFIQPRQDACSALEYKLNITNFIIAIMLGTGEEVQQPEQEQDQADKVLKAHHEQVQLVREIKEIEREMESLGSTFTFESSALEARGKLAKIQVHCNH